MSLTPVFPVLLRISRRDIRITRGKIIAPRLPSGASALKFVDALLKRYLDRARLESQISLVLIRTRIGVAIQHQHRHLHTNVMPQLALTILAWNPRSNSPNHFIQIPSGPRLRVEQETQLIKTVTLKRETQLLEQLVDQIVSHKRRVEINSEPSFAWSSVAPMPEVKRVVRRATLALTDQAPATHVAEQKLEGKLPELKGNNVYRSSEASLDVNRLTDQVIQAIDRRIIAQRERLGRI